MDQPAELICNGCGRTPEQIPIYVELAAQEGLRNATAYVWRDEGTLNRGNGHFLCDKCYIDAGMPTSPTQWKAP